MKQLARAQDLAIEALRALPRSSPVAESVRAQIQKGLEELAALRREHPGMRGAGAGTRATRTGGRLLMAALLAQRDSAQREQASFGASIQLLLKACAELVDAEANAQVALLARASGMLLRTPEAIRKHLDVFGSLRAVNIVGVKSALSLAGADLSASEWQDCDLSGSDLKGANLSKAHLASSRFAGADLANANLNGADLSKADFTDAVLHGASLVQCLLTEAIAEGIDLTDCDLSDSTLKRAKLRGVTGARVRARQANFVEADLRGAKLPGLDASHTDANGAMFEGADLTGACFRAASLEGAVLRGVIARDVSFDRARLLRADVRSSSLAGATFRFADLSHAQLDQSILVGGSLAHANLHRTSREAANLTNTDLRGSRATDPDRARAEDFRRPT